MVLLSSPYLREFESLLEFQEFSLAMGEVHVASDELESLQKVRGSAKVATSVHPCLWYEEEIDKDLRWTYSVSSILHTGTNKIQDICLIETGPFGKVLLLDGKMQSAEADEFVYHEALVHPSLLSKAKEAKSVFIMGGGEGSTAREVLKHKSVTRLVMCDIDEEVVNFCRLHLTGNHETFASEKLELLINDAREELKNRADKFDVVISDLSDPVQGGGGPCDELYTKSFYKNVVKPRMNPDGVFVTQAGSAGILSHKQVFTGLYTTLKQVFKYVVPYSAHIPSYADVWGWIMASDSPLEGSLNSSSSISLNIQERLNDTTSLRYLDGQALIGMLALNKSIRQSLPSTAQTENDQE